MRLSTVVKRLRDAAGKDGKPMPTHDFGKAIGVSHTAVVEWEDGKGISPFNKMRLLAFAESLDAVDDDVLAALRAAQPELRP